MAFCATSECWQVAPATPCATLYSSVRALALPQDTNLVSEENRTFPGAGGERPPTRPEGKQALVSSQVACSGGDCPCTSTAALPTGAWCFQDRQPGGQGRGQAEQSQLRSGSPLRSLTSRAQRLPTDQAQLTGCQFAGF